MAGADQMRQYTERYDALKAELQSLGFLFQGSLQTRRIACGKTHLPLLPRPGRPARSLPLLDTQGPRKNRRHEAH